MAGPGSGDYQVWNENFPDDTFTGSPPIPRVPRGYHRQSSCGGLYLDGYSKIHYALGDQIEFWLKTKGAVAESALGLITGVRPEWDKPGEYGPGLHKGVHIQVLRVYDWNRRVYGQQYEWGIIKTKFDAKKAMHLKAVVSRNPQTPQSLYATLSSSWTCGIEGQTPILELVPAARDGQNKIHLVFFTLFICIET